MRTLDTREIDLLKDMLNRKKTRGVTKLRVAIYARKSAEDERQTSISAQIDACKRLIDSYDFMEHTYTYQEDNASGMFTDGREQYQAMMDSAERGEFDVIVVMKLDRLARSLCDSTTAVKLLRAYGCYLVAGDDVSNPNTPDGEFLRNIMLAQAQFYARRVASDVMTSECKNARDGKSAGGIAPYGLKLIDKRFEINETEAPAVKMMFEMVDSGFSYQDIIDKLAGLGYMTRSGERFSYSTVSTMLANDKYYGTYVYNRKDGKRRKHRVLIESFDEVRNETAIEPIISKELFDRVQIVRQARKACLPKQNAYSDFVLTGLVFCKSCGKSMSGGSQTGGRGKARRRFYRCPNHTSRNGCTCSTKDINAEYLEGAIEDLLTASINDYIGHADGSVIFGERIAVLQEERAQLSRHISDTERQIAQFLKRAAQTTNPLLIAQYEKQATDYAESVERNRERLTEYDSSIAAFTGACTSDTALSREQIFASLSVAREIIHIFISRIEVDDSSDDISITFND